MNKGLNQSIIENRDSINFDLKIKNKHVEEEPIKIKDKKIIIGLNQIPKEIDDQLIGINLNEDRIFEFELEVANEINVFENLISPGNYIFSFKINNLEKNKNVDNIEKTIRIKIDKDEDIDQEKINIDKEELNQSIDENELEKNENEELVENFNENELIELKELNKALKNKIEKLEQEKAINEISFKMKAEEIAKNAIEKVEKIKEEIKSKAKEEIETKSKFATQRLVENLIGPINNLDIVIESGSNNDNPAITGYVKGFQMILSQILSTLENNGVKTISPNIGDEYKPEIHEAQEVIEANGFQKDQIIKIISKGYTLHDRVIKPAVVIVAK